jgi:hypothetical protein
MNTKTIKAIMLMMALVTAFVLGYLYATISKWNLVMDAELNEKYWPQTSGGNDSWRHFKTRVDIPQNGAG